MELLNRPVRRALPGRAQLHALSLSLCIHGLLLAALWIWKLGTPEEARTEPTPVSIRLRYDTPLASMRLEEPPHFDRSFIPPQASDASEAAVELPATRLEDLDPDTSLVLFEPSRVSSSAMGVAPAGSLRAPRALAAPAVPAAAAALVVPAEGAPQAGSAAGEYASGLAASGAPRGETGTPGRLNCPRPEYPRLSIRLHEEGSVRCELEIDGTGTVCAVRVLESSGIPRLDEAAREGLLAWRFAPSPGSSRAQRWRLEHTVVFRIE